MTSGEQADQVFYGSYSQRPEIGRDKLVGLWAVSVRGARTGMGSHKGRQPRTIYDWWRTAVPCSDIQPSNLISPITFASSCRSWRRLRRLFDLPSPGNNSISEIPWTS